MRRSDGHAGAGQSRGTSPDLPQTAPAPKAAWARPLRVHLSVVIVTLLVCISVPLMWLTFRQGTNEALAAAEQQMTLLGRHTVDRFQSLFSEGYAVVTMASAVKSLTTEPPADAEPKADFMIKALQGSPNIDSLYIGYPSGAFVQALNVGDNARWREAISAPPETVFALRTIVRPPDAEARSTWEFLDGDRRLLGQRSTDDVTFDPRRRPWYKAAAYGTDVVAVGPYVSASTGSLSLTLASPTIRESGLVAGADVVLETISRLLAAEAVSKNTRGYVFDDRKRLIVHSDSAVMDLVLEDLGASPRADGDATPETLDPALEAVREALSSDGEAGDRTVRFMVGSQPYLATISTVGFSRLIQGSTIVVAAPLEDFVGASTRLLRRTLLIAGIFVVVGIAAALLVARVISRALTKLTADARQIGNLDFEQRAPVHSWISEINTLTETLGAARNAIRTFALYVPRELVRKLIASGQGGVGAATRQDVTVLFTDIRDFTTISEQRSPEEVVSLLTGYFQVMNDIVERHNGVIVQYLGDSIYAMWNAPAPDPDHVNDGCRCALALKAGVDQFNQRNRESGLPELVTRYGLHTGAAVVGSVGAQARRQYTAMGDTVNVASRLEGLNKEFGTTILASEAVKTLADPSFQLRPLGAARAKGRMEQIDVFELTEPA